MAHLLCIICMEPVDNALEHCELFIGAAGLVTKAEMQPLEGKTACQSWGSVIVPPHGIVELSPTTVYHWFELMLCMLADTPCELIQLRAELMCLTFI